MPPRLSTSFTRPFSRSIIIVVVVAAVLGAVASLSLFSTYRLTPQTTQVSFIPSLASSSFSHPFSHSSSLPSSSLLPRALCHRSYHPHLSTHAPNYAGKPRTPPNIAYVPNTAVQPTMSRRTSTRLPGLSKSISLHGFRGRVRRTRVLQAGRQADRLRNNDKQRVADIQLLAAEDQDAVDRMFEDQGMDLGNGEPVPFSSPDSDSDHESDHEFSGLPEHVSGWRRADCRDRRDRIELQVNRWDAQMPCLVEAYLDFRSRSSDNCSLAEEHAEAFAVPAVPLPDIITDIELVDIFSES
ncbi:hypothetical protein BKA83DRAFT_4568584 [Pisolithus microcarpus]|nr:hypothetical protein BKA83DRAFT_4568584 [Pisolithus microcarpus]